MSKQPFIIDKIGGYCPVQAEGFVGSKPFYFRARGNRWSMSIGGEDVIGEPDWYYEEPYGSGPYDAGWMSEQEARAFIAKAVGRYLDEQETRCALRKIADGS